MTNLNSCENLKNGFKERTFDKKRFKQRFDNDLANLFKYLKVTDSSSLLETKVYKTINIKKEKSHQQSRESRTEEISNYVEAIKPNQSFVIEIKDTHEDNIFQNIGTICNRFYIPFLGIDEKIYATKNGYIKDKVKELSSNVFLINVGRFGGAEQKSLNNLREIKGVKESDKSTTTARSFALEKSIKDKVYYENELLPFGWILCEKVENEAGDRVVFNQQERYKAIDTIRKLQEDKIYEAKAAALKKEEERLAQEKAEAEAKAKREAELAAMDPLDKLIDSYDNDIAKVINAMKDGSIENFDEMAVALAKKLKERMQKDPKLWEKAKKKALVRKEYIESLL
jgi:hypothetical protein